jgi:glycosyltransferase involved in cell wall biosynthesis
MKLTQEKNFIPILHSEICIIIPTFNRPKQLNSLLKTISEQTLMVGHIVIADGMGDALEIVNIYDQLPIKWLNCPVKGQISQRNYALNHLSPVYKIIIYFDDTIQLETNAIEEMMNFWNNQLILPAGVSFTILDLPERPDNYIRHLFLMGTEPRGKVWRSGYNSPCENPHKNMTSDWLPGGCTAWRRDILDTYAVSEIPSTWAVCEDLIFSYPVGKKESLFMCNEANFKEIDDITKLGFFRCLERGKSTVLWRLYFVSINSELSVLLFFWMNIGLLVGYIEGSLKGDRCQLGYFFGTFLGVFFGLYALLIGKSVRDLLR